MTALSAQDLLHTVRNITDDRNLMNMKARWFVRGMLVGIALMLALNFVLTR